ncbi:MAG: hypothetical protein EOP04_21915 [Proteobacteria bacterium]|nr:MAG: hypothetical protein EOP04_21915 [Pseudomonadota bacterium]
MASTSVARYALRELLTVIPPCTSLEPYRDQNLNTWRTGGSYTYTSSTKSEFVLQVNHREFAAATFADAQHLLNQTTEHRAQLLQCISSGNEPSPTWLFVTLYYMGLYAALAWTRAVNQAVVYLDKDAIQKFCGSSPTIPGGGSFIVKFVDLGIASSPEVHISKSLSHFHEAVWARVAHIASDAYKWINLSISTRSGSAEELLALRALDILSKAPFKSMTTWPSKLRNALNYRPGFSYRGVVKNNILRTKSRLSQHGLSDLESIVSYCETARIKIGKAEHPADSPNESIDLLIGVALLLEYFADESFLEICKVQDLTSSASRQRKSYRKTNCTAPKNTLLAV